MTEQQTVQLTYRGLLEQAHESFMMGYRTLTVQGEEFPISYLMDESIGDWNIWCVVYTEAGPIAVYTQRPQRNTAAGRFAQRGAVILRISINQEEKEFGLVAGQYVQNVERECARAILA